MTASNENDENPELTSSRETTQYIQNFNAPVGAVLNDGQSQAFVNQSSSTNGSRAQSDDITVDSVKLLVTRFLSVYENHGIRAHQIPKFAVDFNVKPSDFATHYSVLNILTDEFISWTCETFGVEKSWMDGDPDWFCKETKQIYADFDLYKSLYFATDLFENYKKLPRRDVCLYAFKNGSLTRDTQNKSIVALVFQERIGEINGRFIYKYKPVTTHWQWDYYKMRYQIKGIFLLCLKNNIRTRGFDLSGDVIDQLVAGEIFPELIIQNCYRCSWFPEDYVSTKQESHVAQESEELARVVFDLKEDGYAEFF